MNNYENSLTRGQSAEDLNEANLPEVDQAISQENSWSFVDTSIDTCAGTDDHGHVAHTSEDPGRKGKEDE